MKANFPRQALLSGLSLTQNLVGASGALPILSNVLFDVTPEGTHIIGTDLECFAKIRIDADVEEAGRVTAPARTLADIVRLLPEGNVAMVTSGTRMTITCGRNEYHLSTMNAQDFPDWPSMEANSTVTLGQSELGGLLRNTLFAIPSRDPRKVLMGALFELKQGRLTCVATDGRKLGKSVVDAGKIDGKKEFQAIVPGRVLHEIERALGEEGDIKVAVSDQRAVFEVENLNLTYLTSLIEGKFPSYESVIPETFKRTISLPKDVVDDAIGRAAILAERKHHSIILSFEDKGLSIRSQSFEDGSYEGSVDIDFEGDPFKIAFNYNYLRDVFKVAPDPTIKMKVKDASAPVVFECESDADTLYLVMPVRIHELEAEPQESRAREEVEV